MVTLVRACGLSAGASPAFVWCSQWQIDDGILLSLQVPDSSQGRELKMSKITVDKKASSKNAECTDAGSATCSFEGKFVSIAGSRLVVESDHDAKTTYALASDALLTCDGKIGKEETLKAGRRIRVTTQKGSSNLVTGIEWLNKNTSFPALKTTAAK